MNILTIKTILESEFASWWPTASGSVPILWDNVVQKDSDTAALYAVVQFIPNAADKVEFGNPGVIRQQGIFSVRLVSKTGIGTGDILTKAVLIANYFSNTSFSGVHTETPSTNRLGIVDGKFQISVTIPWYCYQSARS